VECKGSLCVDMLVFKVNSCLGELGDEDWQVRYARIKNVTIPPFHCLWSFTMRGKVSRLFLCCSFLPFLYSRTPSLSFLLV
jgi:hypothetical protein